MHIKTYKTQTSYVDTYNKSIHVKYVKTCIKQLKFDSIIRIMCEPIVSSLHMRCMNLYCIRMELVYTHVMV